VTITDADGNVIGQTVVEGNGEWTARLQPQAAEGSVVTVTQTDPAGNISAPVTLRIGKIRIVVDLPLLRNGETQTAHVYNLQPGETVKGVMYSDPVDLGSLVADASGSAVFSVVIPYEVSEGAHRIEATGTFSGKAVSGYFNVVPEQAPVVPQTVMATPTVTQTAEPTLTVAPEIYKPAAHPPTGAEGMIPAAGTALGALLAGLFLILAAARRRREIEEDENGTAAAKAGIRR
jgi:hypothetical protein